MSHIKKERTSISLYLFIKTHFWSSANLICSYLNENTMDRQGLYSGVKVHIYEKKKGIKQAKMKFSKHDN